MPTTDEKRVLTMLDEEGSESHEVTISNQMGNRLVYMRAILDSMARRGYVDILAGGKVRISDKGWTALGKEPGQRGTMQGDNDLSPTASPEEKYKKWMSR